MHKMNVVHLHLTDDQGWRIEIKRYPRLTEIGSQRKETMIGHARHSKAFDGVAHSGFYTQDDLREIVAYAAERFVTILPEIDMPGHAQAAIAAYPELGVTGEQIEVGTRWGICPHLYNPNDETLQFLKDVCETESMDKTKSKGEFPTVSRILNEKILYNNINNGQSNRTFDKSRWQTDNIQGS